MTFISYAQNLEDVMLWRALGDVPNGFYIDAGANDPDVESVTKAFYERGWNGINIEPLPSHHAALLKKRIRDINILAAVGDKEGEIELWEGPIRGWATASAEVASTHESDGFFGVRHEVRLTTLTSICERYVNHEIHFLKIDVEGFEKEAIEGMNFVLFRPWILVIESTFPNTITPNYQTWESSVLSYGYEFAYSDGLNRFYVATEHAGKLMPKFQYPPNVFDDYRPSALIDAESRAKEAESRAQMSDVSAAQAYAELDAVYASTSWRITAPLRNATNLLHTLSINSVTKYIKDFVVSYIRQNPYLNRLARGILKRFPRISELAHRFSDLEAARKVELTPNIPLSHTNLTPGGRAVYHALKTGREGRSAQ